MVGNISQVTYSDCYRCEKVLYEVDCKKKDGPLALGEIVVIGLDEDFRLYFPCVTYFQGSPALNGFFSNKKKHWEALNSGFEGFYE